MAVNGEPHSPPQRRARHTLHVPTLHSDGTRAPRALITWIEDRLIELGGGFTRLNAHGGWKREDGSNERDDLLIYVVDLAEASPLALGSIAQRVAVELDQDAVYLTVQTLEVVHVHAVTATPTFERLTVAQLS
jgi:hypothetical protein